MSLAAVLAGSAGGDLSPPAGRSLRQGNPQLTYAELVFYRHRVGRWIRFGQVAEEHLVSRRTRFVGFAPGAVFAFVRWASSGGGAGIARLDILQAVCRSSPCSTVPGVTPGAEILLRLTGWPKVRKALEAIDAIEALGIDPADAAPDYWRHLGQRLSVGEAARSYTLERHAAWLARRELAP
jgi:hypothetical protein